MKKKHAERSLTGLLAAWLLLMAVWLVPGSAWARIAPNGGEATPARGAYEVLAETSAEVRGVSTAAPREGEESVAEGQREGVPTGVGALRPTYTAERTSPTVSAREVKPRAPSGNGTLHFKLGDDIKNDLNTLGLFFAVKTTGPAGVKDPHNYVFGDGQLPAGARHFVVGYVFSPTPGNEIPASQRIKLNSGSKGIFSYHSVSYEITVLAAGKSATLVHPNGWLGTVWMRKNGNEDIDIYIRRVDKKIPLTVEHYVDGERIEASDGLKVVYDSVRQAGWDAASVGGVKIPKESTLQYNWKRDSVQVDGVAMRPKRILINGEECPIPEASKDGEAPKVGEWNVPNAASEVIIKVEWEKDVRKITYSYNGTEGREPEIKISGQTIANGTFITTEAVTLGVNAISTTNCKPFAYSVNGVVKRNPDEGSLAPLIVTEMLPAGKEDVNIVVYFVPDGERISYYTVTVNQHPNGTVIADPKVAKDGEKITVTIKPNPGYAVESWTAVYLGQGMSDPHSSNPEDNSFFMPNANVEVEVTFKRTHFDETLTVTDNGSSVAGATVTIVDKDGQPHTATTGSDGRATVPLVPAPTEGTVTVEKDGKVVTVPVKVDEHGAMTPATVDLSDANIAPVTVTVVEKGTTTGIANATVTVGAQKVQAGANGEVTLRLVKNGIYNGVTATASGYLNDTVTLKVNDDGSVTPNKIELRKTAPVAVTVTDGGTGVDGARVTIVDDDGKKHEATTGADGRTTVQGVPVPTEGTVTVEKDGKVVTVPVKVDEHGAMTPATVDLSDANIATVTVTVVEKGTTTGIANATVTIGGQTATADGDGVAKLYLVKKETYAGVTASAAGYEEKTETLTVKADGKADPAQIALAKKAAGQSDPYLHVFVVDENLQAIDRVSVSVNVSGEEPRVTDRAGHTAWQLAANVEYELTLKKEGYIPVTAKVLLKESGHDLTVVMQREAKADPKKEDPKGQVTAVESALLAGASLYPNPAREYTTLHGLEHAEMVSILTLSGVEVQRLAVPGEREHKLDVSSLAEGIYLVVLETRGGERRVLKLVVRR